jgi:hypothetical protein
MKKHLSLAHLSFLLCILLIATATQAQTVLTSKRIGGYAEDIEFVSAGPLKNYLVMVDGFEVLGVPNFGHKNQELTKLFDLRCTSIGVRPNGLAYIESENLFVLNDVSQINKLFLVDHQGRPQGAREIKYLNGYLPVHLEGLAYIPANSPNFPDHLLLVAWDSFGAGPNRIEVLRRDGQVVAEIQNPNWPPEFTDNVIGDVAFLQPNRLLVTLYSNSIWTIDFNGNIISGPVATPETGGEGIALMRNHHIAYIAYPQSFRFFDKHLNRLPNLDRNDIVGLGVNLPRGIAWNSDTNRYIINHVSQIDPDGLQHLVLSELPSLLDSVAQVADLSAANFGIQSRRLSYLPGEHLTAVAHFNAPRAILLFKNDGTLDSQIDLSGLGLGRPFAVAYVPATNQFAVVFSNPNDPAEARKIRILSRTGALVRTIDMTCTGVSSLVGLAFFNPSHPSGGQFLVIGTANRILVTDFNGSVLREFNSRIRLGMITPTDVTAITTGPQADAFAMVDNGGGEIVVFRLD